MRVFMVSLSSAIVIHASDAEEAFTLLDVHPSKFVFLFFDGGASSCS